MNRSICILILLLLIGLGSCKKKNTEPDICGTSWTTALADKANAMIAAAITYSSTPTTANCNAYKATVSAYIDGLEPYGKCSIYATGTNKAQFDAAIAEARAELQNACQ